jgi:ABC-type glutathione transport system ATPase component
MNTALMELRSISGSYVSALVVKKRRPVLTDISLTLCPGETLALIGASGCGKTTLAKVMLRLIPADSGQILWKGLDITRLKGGALRRLRSEMQIIFQNPETALNPCIKLYDSIAEIGRLHGFWKADSLEEQAAVADLAAMTGLGPELLDRLPRELSGGQLQRSVLARALSIRPKLLVADEPTSMLDVSVQAQILNLLKETQRRNNHACLLISHDLDVVRVMADRIAVLFQGKLVEVGPTEEVLSNPRNSYARDLIAASLQEFL